VGRYPDSDFAGTGGEKVAGTGGRIKHQGQAAGPEDLYQNFCRVWNMCHQFFQVGGAVDQDQEGIGFRALLDVKYFSYGPGIHGIGSQAVKALGGKHHHALIVYDCRCLADGIRVGVIRMDPDHP
jgi:hypothetical protein